MLKPRSILFIVVMTAVIYVLSPAERKRKIREKIKLVWTALVIALVIYWIFLLGAAGLNYWKNG